MKYRFDLEGSQLALLLTGALLAGVLLFIVGMVLGAGSVETAPEVAVVEVEAGAGAEQPAPDEPSAAATAPPAAPAPAASQEPGSGEKQRIYELQLSAHLAREAAQPVIDELAAANLQPYVIETKDSRDRVLFTVRLGPWDSMIEAAQAAKAFREQSGIVGLEPVIRHRPRPMAAGPPTGSPPPSQGAG